MTNLEQMRERLRGSLNYLLKRRDQGIDRIPIKHVISLIEDIMRHLPEKN